MALQQAINTGARAGMTPEKRIGLMLENSVNVFILRWKKENEFRTSYFGFEIIGFVARRDPRLMETTYVPTAERGELFFEPDENNVPTAYCADTPYNRRILALSFYSAHYTIAGLITPTGAVNRDIIQAEIKKMATELGVKEPVRTRIVGVYGNSLPVADRKKEEIPPVIPDPAKSVFGSAEKQAEKIPKAPDPATLPKLSRLECDKQAEETVYARLKPLIDKLQIDSGRYWKAGKYYKDIVVPEIKKEIIRLYDANGIVEQICPASVDAGDGVADGSGATASADASPEPLDSPQ